MAEQYEMVGMGTHQLGSVEGWMVTYEKPDGNFHHHMFPATIFYNYAQQFGLDIDDPDDFDEVLDIVLYDPFAGDHDPSDEIETPQPNGLMAGKKKDKKNKLGRDMRRRADRGKTKVEITGTATVKNAVRDRLRDERHKGVAEAQDRIRKLDKLANRKMIS